MNPEQSSVKTDLPAGLFSFRGTIMDFPLISIISSLTCMGNRMKYGISVEFPAGLGVFWNSVKGAVPPAGSMIPRFVDPSFSMIFVSGSNTRANRLFIEIKRKQLFIGCIHHTHKCVGAVGKEDLQWKEHTEKGWDNLCLLC